MSKAIYLAATAILAASIFPIAAYAQASGASAPAPTTPKRTLVYSVQYSGYQHGAATNDPGTNGARTYTGHLTDQGTITVNVLREQPDRGLVVTVAEQARDTRTAPTAMCVVYGNTNVICDPNKTVNSEEYAVLRFLGTTFVDPNQIDPKQHWRIQSSSPALDLTADYQITGNDNGLMTIDETREVKDKSVGVLVSNIDTKLQYDYSRLVPTSINEYTVERQEGGAEAMSTATYQTALKLLSDSMAKATASSETPH